MISFSSALAILHGAETRQPFVRYHILLILILCIQV